MSYIQIDGQSQKENECVSLIFQFRTSPKFLFDKLKQLMLVEEFKRCIISDVKTFLDEKQVETLEEAARLADDYHLTHKVSFIAKPKPISSIQPNSNGETKSQYPLSRPTCNYCKKPGHLVFECLKLKKKLGSD